MKIIGDPGSCHLGNLEKARELVNLGAACGLDAVKFQLLTDKETKAGNIGIDWNWMPELIAFGEDRGIDVFASVFDLSGAKYLADTKAKAIKYAYGQSKLLWYSITSIRPDMAVYASYDVMSATICQQAIKLYCIPEYPVRYQIDFEGLFPRFDGFSDHTLGYQQTIRAAEAGAQYIEKHFQGDWEAPCPDGRFALRPAQLDEMVKRLKR